MYIDVSSQPFAITSLPQFITNLKACIPVYNISVGVSRILATYDEKVLSSNEKTEKPSSISSLRLWEHRVRGIMEILGLGIVLCAVEILGLAVGAILAGVLCLIVLLGYGLFCIVSVVGGGILYLGWELVDAVRSTCRR
ncbi:hypothetical protein C10C_0248 [Chlamydia serpentis]|uniref:Uncharacterized protein n=2 Tax=Chlamydia serpentis TaxID=1967782 RepID=A0A2R8FAR9_9CHLA|nr:hypothetical protein C10C_0248 [Chlamydia serpentis]